MAAWHCQARFLAFTTGTPPRTAKPSQSDGSLSAADVSECHSRCFGGMLNIYTRAQAGTEDGRDTETGTISFSHSERNVTATWLRLSRDKAAHYIRYRQKGEKNKTRKVCRLCVCVCVFGERGCGGEGRD